ncbi:MAG TPA: membrane protein insertion efficiency factor YidD [Actinomycetota bacterium]|nr:membrane protein insertion efficiency factor YidD [Actinomycetota bacterium]
MSLQQRMVLFLIHVYQKGISPSLAPRCRFSPSCSEYAVSAVERHGAAGGIYLAVRRLGRCHPLREPGVDEVPETFTLRSRDKAANTTTSHLLKKGRHA